MRNTLNLADKTALNILANSSEAVLLLLSSIIMARHLPKTDYGTFLQLLLVTDTAIMLTLFGFPQSIYYFVPQIRQKKTFLIRNACYSLCPGIFTALVVYRLHAPLGAWLNNPFLIHYGWVAPLLIFFRTPSHFRTPILIAHERLLINSVSTLLWNLLFFAPVIAATLLSGSLETILKTMLIFSGCQWGCYLALMAWMIHTAPAFSSEAAEPVENQNVSFVDQLKYALPIGISSELGIIGRRIDQYIISAFFTPQNFAVYSRGAMRIPFISTIRFTLNDIMMPEYVRALQAGEIQVFLQKFHFCIEKVAKINFPLFSCFFALAPSLVTLLYTRAYLEAASILRVYLCLLPLQITVYGVIPRASGKTACIMSATLLNILCNISLSLLMVSTLGPIGAALATIIAAILVTCYYLVQSCKILHVSFRAILPWKLLAQLLGIALSASIPLYCLEFMLHSQKSVPLFALLLGEGLLFFYCWLFLMMRRDFISADELESLTKWFRFDVQRFLRKITGL